MLAEPITWLTSHAVAAALVFSRAAGIAWTAPALGTPGLEGRFRLILAALLAFVLAPAVVTMGAALDLALPALGAACVVEVIVGAALGWSSGLFIAGARQAGELVSLQAGFSAAALFDPEVGDELSALGCLYGLVALAVFLALDGPVSLVRGVVESYHVIPPGLGTISEATVGLAFGRVGEALALALCAAAPVALAQSLASVGLGLIGRAAPSLPLVALSIPVRAWLGLVLVFLSLVTLVATLSAAWVEWAKAF
jgi:flagellar biosynthesis protein FliR